METKIENARRWLRGIVKGALVLLGRIADWIIRLVSVRKVVTSTAGLISGLVIPPAPPPFNSPPVWDSQPNISFVFGVSSEFDMDDISSDPDSDPLDIALNTGTAALGTGVSWNPTTHVLSYDGAGAINTTNGHIFTLDDGTETVDSDTISIVISTGRSVQAGVYLIWEPINNTVMDLTFVKGGMPRSDLGPFVSSGNYADTGSFSVWQIRNSWNNLRDAVGGPKGGQMQITSKKPTDWQKHVWYANGAEALGAVKFEEGDWIGAWWGPDGLDVMKGCFDLSTWFWDSSGDMPQDMKDRCIGIRVNYNAITSEGIDPGPTLENMSHGAWTQGSSAGAKPANYTSTLKRTYFSLFINYVLDQAFPVSDSNPELYPLLHRARHGNYGATDVDASTESRVKALWAADQIGIVATDGNQEPSSPFHEQAYQAYVDYCKFAGGNTRAFNEGFGYLPDNANVDGQWSVLQMIYWTILLNLHAGVSYLGIRDEYADNVGLGGSLAAEWQAAMDFAEKYAGYQQFPSSSPGAWLALREGNRLTGNYTFLMTQIVSGDGVRGTELYAGSDGDSFPWGGNDYVGEPSNKTHQSGTDGFGSRQAIWAFQFSAGQKLKTVLDSTYASTLDGVETTVRINYLDNNNNSFEVSAFGNVLGTVNCGNTNDWLIAEFVIGSTSVSTDVDGAHIVVETIGGNVRYHMVEIEKT